MIKGAAVAKTKFEYRPIEPIQLTGKVIENFALRGHAEDEAVEPAHEISVSIISICEVGLACCPSVVDRWSVTLRKREQSRSHQRRV